MRRLLLTGVCGGEIVRRRRQTKEKDLTITVMYLHLGLAAFSRKLNKDPWNETKQLGGKGQLCARLEGGSIVYFSPEQAWLCGELEKVRTEDEYWALKNRWQITPATSDLYQAALSVYEMHARRLFVPLGSATGARMTMVDKCVNRLTRQQLESMAPEGVEQWAVHTLKLPVVDEKFVAKKIDGKKLFSIMDTRDLKTVAYEIGLKIGTAKVFMNEFQNAVCTPYDVMHAVVAKALKRSLDDQVGKRPTTAGETLSLFRVKDNGEDPESGSESEADDDEDVDLTRYPNCMWPPEIAIKPATEHGDEEVASTLGDLAKALVLHDTPAGALDACTEWLGVASSAAARKKALNAYCDLWKRYGSTLRSLDLSRSAHGHWRLEMLAGQSTAEKIASAIWESGDAALESVDFAEQTRLTGNAIEVFVGEHGQASLRHLRFHQCRCISGTVPPSISGCTNLLTLDVSDCSQLTKCKKAFPLDATHYPLTVPAAVAQRGSLRSLGSSSSSRNY